MTQADILIVGGSAAGVTAAITARRFHPDAEITLVRKEEKVLIPCGIPYIFGTVGTPEKNLIPDTVLDTHRVNRLVDEVKRIDPKGKKVTTANGSELRYERMILTTGSVPFVPPLPGVELDNVYPVWKDVSYLDGLLAVLKKARDVVVIGGGFIGVEFADECKKLGIQNVTVIELLPRCLLLACDEEVCGQAESKLSERGIKLCVNCRAESLVGNGRVEAVQLADGTRLKADAVILGIGVAPNVTLAEEAGLRVDRRAGIDVDAFMQTSDPSILAAGDCAQRKCYFTGRTSGLRLASIATIEARVAGANLSGLQRRTPGAVGIFATKIGDLALGSAGMTQKAAQEAGFRVVAAKASAPDKHPGCMPDTHDLTVKLVFDRSSGVIVGGQAYGGDTTGEVINFIGAMIQHRARADEIATFQVGTHPALTASPIAYQVVNAAETALSQMHAA